MTNVEVYQGFHNDKRFDEHWIKGLYNYFFINLWHWQQSRPGSL